MAGFFKRLFGGSNNDEMVGAIEVPGEAAYIPGSSLEATHAAGIYGAGSPMTPEEHQLAVSGHVLQCIEAYRSRTGATAEQTRTVLEPVLASVPYVPLPSKNGEQASVELSAEEVRLIESGHPIEAIKRFRERTEASLVESKAVVDRYFGK